MSQSTPVVAAVAGAPVSSPATPPAPATAQHDARPATVAQQFGLPVVAPRVASRLEGGSLHRAMLREVLFELLEDTLSCIGVDCDDDGLWDYVEALVDESGSLEDTVVAAIVYCWRVHCHRPGLSVGRADAGKALFTAALALAWKVTYDTTFYNSSWAKISAVAGCPFSTAHMNSMELELLAFIDFEIHIGHKESAQVLAACSAEAALRCRALHDPPSPTDVEPSYAPPSRSNSRGSLANGCLSCRKLTPPQLLGEVAVESALCDFVGGGTGAGAGVRSGGGERDGGGDGERGGERDGRGGTAGDVVDSALEVGGRWTSGDSCYGTCRGGTDGDVLGLRTNAASSFLPPLTLPPRSDNKSGSTVGTALGSFTSSESEVLRQ